MLVFYFWVMISPRRSFKRWRFFSFPFFFSLFPLSLFFSKPSTPSPSFPSLLFYNGLLHHSLNQLRSWCSTHLGQSRRLYLSLFSYPFSLPPTLGGFQQLSSSLLPPPPPLINMKMNHNLPATSVLSQPPLNANLPYPYHQQPQLLSLLMNSYVKQSVPSTLNNNNVKARPSPQDQQRLYVNALVGKV